MRMGAHGGGAGGVTCKIGKFCIHTIGLQASQTKYEMLFQFVFALTRAMEKAEVGVRVMTCDSLSNVLGLLR